MVADRAAAIDRYADELDARDDLAAFLAPLAGADLACYCPLDEACHADVLLAALAGLAMPSPERPAPVEVVNPGT